MMTIKVDGQEFGTILVCALRYAMGRMTYMPDFVRKFVRPLLPKLPDKTIGVMLNDCDFQRRTNTYGDERIDKPGWIKWEQELKAEQERRNNGV